MDPVRYNKNPEVHVIDVFAYVFILLLMGAVAWLLKKQSNQQSSINELKTMVQQLSTHSQIPAVVQFVPQQPQNHAGNGQQPQPQPHQALGNDTII